MSDAADRCARCREPVGTTIHTAGGYRVRGYRVVVGKVQEALIQGREDGREREYLRLVDPRTCWLCPRCSGDRTALADLGADWSDEPAS